MFEDLKARLDRFLAEHTVAPDRRTQAAQLQAAIIDAKVAVAAMRSSLGATERELTGEQQQLRDAERRGRMASEIEDAETVRIAESFVVRHRERIGMLERKLVAQREELVLAERDLDEMMTRLKSARLGTAGGPDTSAAWRDLEAAGGVRPDLDLESELLKRDLQQKERDAAVEAQLAHLKKKLGKDKT